MRSINRLAVTIALCVAIPTLSYGADKSKDLYYFGEEDGPSYTITASGHLPPDAIRTYDPENAFDDDRGTSWCVQGGVGNWIKIEFKNLIYVKDVIISPGGAGDLYFANHRAEKVRVKLSDGQEFTKELFDSRGPKYVRINESTKSVTIFVEYVYPGRKKDVLCINEIDLETGDTNWRNH